MPSIQTPFKTLLLLLQEVRAEIRAVYFYAILSGAVALVLPLGTQAIISFVMGGVLSVSLVLLIVLVVGATLVIGLLQVNQKKIIEKIEQKIFVRYGFLYSNTIPRLDLRNTQEYYLPELSNRFFDTVTIQKSIAKLLLAIPEAIIQILFSLILLSFYNPIFIVFGLLLLAVLGIILRLTGRRGLETSLKESDYKYQLVGFLEELSRAVTSFKFRVLSALHLRRTDDLVGHYLKWRTAHFKILLTQYWTLIIFKVLITTAMLVVGSGLLLQQKLNIGQFVATELVIITVIYSVEKLISSLEVVYDVLAATDKVTKLPEKQQEVSGNLVLESEEGISVEMEGLSFSYKGEEAILKNINGSIASGEKVIITGPTGSGKSTLLRVISGLLQPTEGVIRYNDIPFREYDLAHLRAGISAVFDTHDVFDGTLLENLTFSNEPPQSIHHVKNLATMLNLQGFIFSHPEGLQQQIPMAGHGLSPRTLLKITLLRALLSQSKLLIIEHPETFLNTRELETLVAHLNTAHAKTTCIISSQSPLLLGTGWRLIGLEENLTSA